MGCMLALVGWSLSAPAQTPVKLPASTRAIDPSGVASQSEAVLPTTGSVPPPPPPAKLPAVPPAPAMKPNPAPGPGPLTASTRPRMSLPVAAPNPPVTTESTSRQVSGAEISGSGLSLVQPATSPSTNDQPSTTGDRLGDVVVTAELDRSGSLISAALGADAYVIGPNQIQDVPGGENAPFQQVLLRAPGVVEDSFGQVHVRGEHNNLTYRINGILLPEGLNGFGQELDTRIISSVTLIDGSLPAQFGFRTAAIVDVTTKSGATLNNNQFSLYGGSYNTIQPSLQLGGTNKSLDYFAVLSYKYDDIGIENPTSSSFPIHDTTQQQKLFTYLAYRLDDTSRLSLLLNISDADFQIPNVPGAAGVQARRYRNCAFRGPESEPE